MKTLKTTHHLCLLTALAGIILSTPAYAYGSIVANRTAVLWHN